MSVLTGRPYAMMNGLGNEILVVDLRGADEPVPADEVREIALRPGLRFDQLMAIRTPRSADGVVFVEIYNSDGSQSGACGNGSRCVAWYLTKESGRDLVAFDTLAGRIACHKDEPWRFSADMGRPRLAWNEIPMRDFVPDTAMAKIDLPPGCAALGVPAAASMGNPHAVFFVDNLEVVDLAKVGPLLEHHPAFPERVNVSLAKVEARDLILLRVWERGVGLTRACGTAACAALVSAVRRDKCDRRSRVRLPGGELTIYWRDDDRVVMTGPCELEGEGWLEPALVRSKSETAR